MTGTVAGIYVAVAPGHPAVAIAAATLEAGRGVVGDRYHTGTGTFSEKLKGQPDVEITLIEVEEIERFNQQQAMSLGFGELRRNIVTRGVRLNDLVGQRFLIGGALLEGVRLCEPCAHLAQVASPAVLPHLVHRAGLRARIVRGATVREGDPIRAQDAD